MQKPLSLVQTVLERPLPAFDFAVEAAKRPRRWDPFQFRTQKCPSPNKEEEEQGHCVKCRVLSMNSREFSKRSAGVENERDGDSQESTLEPPTRPRIHGTRRHIPCKMQQGCAVRGTRLPMDSTCGCVGPHS
eukprot:1601369-Rhodomonas_salina.1